MEYRGKSIRNELKYVINDLEYNYLKNTLKRIMEFDENVNEEGEYHIRSLYFDDLLDSSYYQKESGVFERSKIRIRIYNKSDEVIRLEKKEKFGKYISKTSKSIGKNIYYSIINNHMNIDDFKNNDFLLEFYTQYKMNTLKPVVIVDYVREPFIYSIGNVRITFDKNLQAIINTNDIFSKSDIAVSPKYEGEMILEVKYDDYLPEFIRNQLNLSRHQLMAISKYTICRDLKNSLNWSEKVLWLLFKIYLRKLL